MKNIFFSYICIIFFTTIAAQNVVVLTTASNNQSYINVSQAGRYFFPAQIQSAQIKNSTSPASLLKLSNNSSGTFEYNNEKVRDATAHYIGENYGGGIVFYVYDNGEHGLIASTADQSGVTAKAWGSSIHTLARANGIGAGKSNTTIIIATQGYWNFDNYAARLCNEYSVIFIDGVTYGDGYLPSEYELNLLYLQKKIIGGFSEKGYWSATEYNSFAAYENGAWFQNFQTGLQHFNNKESEKRVRAIRAF